MWGPISLVAELAPKVIGARKPVVDLWPSADGIIATAEKTGKIASDSALRLKALVDSHLAALDRNAAEAKAVRWRKISPPASAMCWSWRAGSPITRPTHRRCHERGRHGGHTGAPA